VRRRSFIARKDNPGCCPGPGWQLLAQQGKRGKTGDAGPPGKDAQRITGWIVDRAAFTVTPIFGAAGPGPALELGELFAQFQNDPAGR
jgi:hypothetical protein